MKYRIQRQDDHGHVFTVPKTGVWFADLAEAEALRQMLERVPHKQFYWIEDEDGRVVPSSAPE